MKNNTAMDFSTVTPFSGDLPAPVPQEVAILSDVAAQREIAEVQGAMVLAKKFPRDQKAAMNKILIACQRPTLAAKALYSYARGGTDIAGGTIILMRAIAQQWGNLQFGIRELEQRGAESTVEAFAWDLETNTREARTFQVRHFRSTKKGGYDISDPRDVYELVANMGARRLRACLEAVIPGDVVEAAKEQCESTLKANVDMSPEAIKNMLAVLEKMGITKEMIEKRIQRSMGAITAAQVMSLRKVHNSIRDGMSSIDDWFEVAPPPAAETKPPNKGGESGQGTGAGTAGEEKKGPYGEKPPAGKKKEQPAAAAGEGATKTTDPVFPAGVATVKPGPTAIKTETVTTLRQYATAKNIDLANVLQPYEVTDVTELTEENGQELLAWVLEQPAAEQSKAAQSTTGQGDGDGEDWNV